MIQPFHTRFGTRLCAQAGVCRLLLQDPQQAAQDVSDLFPGDQVTSFEMRLWLPLFGSAWAECRCGFFFCPRSCSVSAQLSCFTYGLAQATGRGCGQAEINNTLPMHTVWMLVHTVWMLVHPLSHCSAPYCAALLPDTRAAHGNYRSVTR